MKATVISSIYMLLGIALGLLLVGCATEQPRVANNGSTSLMQAAQHGHTETSADVNAKNKYGWTPLMLAANFGNTETVQALLAKGAEVNAKANNGGTALMAAARQGHTEIVEALLAKGAEVNAKDYLGMTPLMRAAEEGHTKIVKALVAKGANVNAKDDTGWTPLMYAVKPRTTVWESGNSSDYDITAILVNVGADVNAKANDGATPLALATSEGNKEIAQLLESGFQSEETPSHRENEAQIRPQQKVAEDSDTAWKSIQDMNKSIANSRNVVAACAEFIKSYPEDKRAQEAQQTVDEFTSTLQRVPALIRDKGISFENGVAINLAGAMVGILIDPKMDGATLFSGIDLKKERSGLMAPHKTGGPPGDKTLEDRSDAIPKVRTNMPLPLVATLLGNSDDMFEQADGNDYQRVLMYALKEQKTAILWFDRADRLTLLHIAPTDSGEEKPKSTGITESTER